MRWDDVHASCDFKPKWLLQSPSAPRNAERCRTCAKRALDGTVSDWRALCLLALTSNDEQLLKEHLFSALGKMRGAPISMFEQVSYALPFLLLSPMLPRLKELQEEFDPEGPLKADRNSERFRLAMTLRDCSMFMKARTICGSLIEAPSLIMNRFQTQDKVP